MKCGQEVQVVDWDGAIVAAAVSQCGGSFLVIVNSRDWRDNAAAPFRNGERLWGWQALLERLVWLIAHPGSKEHPAFAYMVRSAGERYAQVTLLPQVRASELAAVLDAPAGEVRERLHDYIVVPEPVGESEGDHASDADHGPALG